MLEKIREDMVGGLSFVFTRKAVVDETFFPQIIKLVQVNCWYRCKSALSLFDVPTNAYWIAYAMGVRF